MYGSKPHLPPTNFYHLAAQQEPYKTAWLLKRKRERERPIYWRFIHMAMALHEGVHKAIKKAIKKNE